MSDYNQDELIATRRLHGLNDGLFKGETMSEEAFNELIDNFEVVAHLTMYGRKGIKDNVKKLQARIKELEEKLEFKKWGDLDNTDFEEYMSQFIPVQKVKDKIEEYFEDEEWLIEHDLKALCDDEKECREYYNWRRNK